MIDKRVKMFLTDYVESITEKSRKAGRNAYICPLCGSGKGKNRTGAFFIYDKGIKWKCFSCDKGGDVLDLIGYVEEITIFQDKLKRAYSLFNLNEDNTNKEY